MKVLIFSIGSSGRAIYRYLNSKNYEIIGFLENNSNLRNTLFDNKPVYLFDEIENLEFDKIAYGGIWSDEMENQLLKSGFEKQSLFFIEDKLLLFSNEEREVVLREFLQEFSSLMRDNNLQYFLDGSSLLYLFRNQELSKAQDIDIMVKSEDELKIILDLLQKSRYFQNSDIIVDKYRQDTPITKSGDLKKIVIKSKSNSVFTEPVILDITALVSIDNYYFLAYLDKYILYYKKEHIDNEKCFEYHNIPILIPSKAEKFLELLYGKNWLIPATKWSYLDYGNILSYKDFESFIQNRD